VWGGGGGGGGGVGLLVVVRGRRYGERIGGTVFDGWSSSGDGQCGSVLQCVVADWWDRVRRLILVW